MSRKKKEAQQPKVVDFEEAREKKLREDAIKRLREEAKKLDW